MRLLTRKYLEHRLAMVTERYEIHAGRKYDPTNGWDQIEKLTVNPDKKIMAAINYGRVMELRHLLGQD